jgi:diaminopimelate epimerase
MKVQEKLLPTNQLILSEQEGESITIKLPLKNESTPTIDASCSCSDVKIQNQHLIINIKTLPLVYFSVSSKEYEQKKYYEKNVTIDFTHSDNSVESLKITIYVYEKTN